MYQFNFEEYPTLKYLPALLDKHFYKPKQSNGQYFTITNPFQHILFFQWKALIDNFDREILLEPFAGSNNISLLMEEVGVYNKWQCYDIDTTTQNNNQKHSITEKDCFANFPQGHKVVITNPPYLARNSATRTGLKFPQSQYDDLYKHSLDLMLKHSDFVAAIIPESFITQDLFKERLFGFISLNTKMFTDTDHPVCLALFVPYTVKDTVLYSGNDYIGLYNTVRKHNLKQVNIDTEIKFNEPAGQIGLYALDNTKERSIRFVKGEDIDPAAVKSTSRAITRILIDKKYNSQINKIIDNCNAILLEHRNNTQDLFLTSFKGLRKDNKYRRRLDYLSAKKIIKMAIDKLIY